MPELVWSDPAALDAEEAVELYLTGWSEEDPFVRARLQVRLRLRSGPAPSEGDGCGGD